MTKFHCIIFLVRKKQSVEVPHFSGNNRHFYVSDMNSKFLMRIIYEYSKFEVGCCQNNKAIIKIFHE